MFRSLYDWSLAQAVRPHAPQALGIVSFAEAVIFPIPVDVMLVPMTMARPEHWMRYASIATITSVLGGVLGYFLGTFFYEFSTAYIISADNEALLQAQELLQAYGFWVIFIAAFMPIPYKVFTLAAGFLTMSLWLFVVGSIVGRAARFFLVAGLAHVLGSQYEAWIRRHIEPIGWALVAAFIAFLGMREW